MGSDFLLLPFKRWFRPPILETPLSTIEIPKTYITVPLCLFSFFVIASGTVYCFVNKMPMTGYIRDDRGRIIPTWIDRHGISNQYLAEGLIAALAYSIGACSLIAAYQVLGKSDEEMTGVEVALKMFGMSAPVWAMCAFWIFHEKIPSYFPMFSPR